MGGDRIACDSKRTANRDRSHGIEPPELQMLYDDLMRDTPKAVPPVKSTRGAPVAAHCGPPMTFAHNPSSRSLSRTLTKWCKESRSRQFVNLYAMGFPLPGPDPSAIA